MNHFKRFFLSRTTIICLIMSVLSAVTLSAFIPQNFLTSSERMLAWQTAHPFAERLSELLGLHRIYTHPFFALVLGAVAISLALSTWNQFQTARRRSFNPDQVISGGECFSVPGTVDETCRTLATHGYHRLGGTAEYMLLVRHPWGYWGNTLLHLGMMVTIAASLFIALTQQRGMIHLAEGSIRHPSEPLLMEEHGLLAKPLQLPQTMRLERISYSFWPNYGVRRVESKVSFLDDSGTAETRTVEINRILTHRGIRFYQGVEFGHAFFVEVTPRTGIPRLYQLQIRHPETPDRPGYNDFQDLLGDGCLLRAKYLVDAEGKSFGNVNPLLTLRLECRGEETGQLAIKAGGEGSIGPYRFHLLGISPWTRLIVVNLSGMPLIFLGFFIICLGGILHYFSTPREALICRGAGAGTEICWRASKFDGFYQDELASLKKALGCG